MRLQVLPCRIRFTGLIRPEGKPRGEVPEEDKPLFSLFHLLATEARHPPEEPSAGARRKAPQKGEKMQTV
jgi:hypothetical protein